MSYLKKIERLNLLFRFLMMHEQFLLIFVIFVAGPWAHGPGPMGPGPKGQSAQRAHRPMAQGPSAHGPGPIGPKGPLGSPGETPLGSQGTPPGIPRDPLKSLFFKNRFFKKISVMLHQWVFYRTYPYDNTIFDNYFSRIFIF